MSTRHAHSLTAGSHVFPYHTRSNACVSDGVSASLSRLCIVIAVGVIVFKPGDKIRRPAYTLKVSSTAVPVGAAVQIRKDTTSAFSAGEGEEKEVLLLVAKSQTGPANDWQLGT